MSISKDKNLEIIKSDVRNLDILNNEIKKHDVIIPFIAVVGAPACDLNPKLATEINLDQIKKYKKIIHKDQIILLPVTNSGYGIGKKDIYCDETSDLNPISHYGNQSRFEKSNIRFRKFCISKTCNCIRCILRMRVDLLVNDFVYKACTDKYLVLFESTKKEILFILMI